MDDDSILGVFPWAHLHGVFECLDVISHSGIWNCHSGIWSSMVWNLSCLPSFQTSMQKEAAFGRLHKGCPPLWISLWMDAWKLGRQGESPTLEIISHCGLSNPTMGYHIPPFKEPIETFPQFGMTPARTSIYTNCLSMLPAGCQRACKAIPIKEYIYIYIYIYYN